MEWPDISTLKLNPTQRDSTNSSEATTPRHRRLKTTRPRAPGNVVVPPDVLNVNQIQKVGADFTQFLIDNDAADESFVSVGFNEVCSNNSNGSEEFEEERNRNEWREKGSSEQLPR